MNVICCDYHAQPEASMRIECTDTFLDGRDRFEKGDIRTVSDEDAARFIALVWAVEYGSAAPSLAEQTTETTLHVNKATHSTKAKVKHG